MPDFSVRSSEIEIMDDLQSSGKIINQTLVELEFINKWLGGNAITLAGLNTLLSKNKSVAALKIADLGCGGGDMLKIIASDFRTKNLQAELTGIDANPNIAEFATKNTQRFSEIKYKSIDILSDDFKSHQYDIIFATLFFHHFNSNQLVEIFRQVKKQARLGIVINDLHRHWLAYYSIKFLTTFFSKSSMVKYDAPLSVLRGFSKKELEEILKRAGIEHYSLQWKWAFRWKLIIHC